MIGDFSRVTTIEPVSASVVIEEGPDTTITGKRMPAALKAWWPWLLLAAGVGVVWYLTRDERERPLDRAAAG